MDKAGWSSGLCHVEWVSVVKVKRVSGLSYHGVLASTRATRQRNFVALVLVQFYGNIN